MAIFSYLLSATSIVTILISACTVHSAEDFKPIFNGRNFNGWEGDTVKTWKVVDGALTGGSLTETVAHNEFICTRKTYSNFIFKTKFKLTGSDGFINTGVQFHSKRATDPAYEMVGYQADLGDGYWASLYDESRRNKTLVSPDSATVKKLLKRNDWNDYEVISENGRIRISLNGTQTVDYTEANKSVPQNGLIGLQIHGGGKALVAYKDIYIKEL